MSSYVLWRRLTETDFNAMLGKASPYGRGGGAMHVALGVRTEAFQIDRFLHSPGQRTVTIEAAGPGKVGRAPLTVSSNPSRRGGEWLIRDQFSRRHPAWSAAAGFPSAYNPNNPPYVLIFRVGGRFHARLANTDRLRKLGREKVPVDILSQPKGIRRAPPALLSAFDIPPQTLLETFEKEATAGDSEAFDPRSVSDGRRRVLAAVLRRLGQQAFRRKLLTAYGTQCAVTRCAEKWVLEAAHITPYRGLKTNAVSNGLLLRADIHTLFDLALISIEPSQFNIRVSGRLAGSHYAEFDGTKLLIPTRAGNRPSPAALAEHYKLFTP
jgi:hypothetical protein